MTILAWLFRSRRDIEALGSAQRGELIHRAADWIRTESAARYQLATALAPSERALLAPYFPTDILDDVRIQRVDDMPSPQFLGALRHHGEQVFDFRDAEGLALDQVILLRGRESHADSPARSSVLFHELVHVVQYHELGVERFVGHYLASLIAVGFHYREIVFEHQAFELQHRFLTEPTESFSVLAEVRALVDELPPLR